MKDASESESGTGKAAEQSKGGSRLARLLVLLSVLLGTPVGRRRDAGSWTAHQGTWARPGFVGGDAGRLLR